MTDDETPTEPEIDDDPRGSRRPAEGRRRTIVIGILAVALAAAAGLALWQTQRVADLRAEADRRLDAARTASEFTLALLSYDFEALDEQTEAIAGLATEDFADEFSDAMDGGLGASIAELRARSTASISEVMVNEVPGDRARAVVVADSEITSEAGSRASTDTYLDVSLVFLDDRWQVDDVRTIATDSPGAGPPDAGAPEGEAGTPEGGDEDPAG